MNQRDRPLASEEFGQVNSGPDQIRLRQQGATAGQLIRSDLRFAPPARQNVPDYERPRLLRGGRASADAESGSISLGRCE